MPRDYITIDTTSAHGDKVHNASVQLRSVSDQIEYLAEVVSHMHDGTDYTDVESKFGVSTGNGALLVAAINNAQTSLNSAGITALISRFGR